MILFFQAKNYINKKIHSENSREAPHVIISNPVVASSEPKLGHRNGSAVGQGVSGGPGGPGVSRGPPSVPPRNGSKLETGNGNLETSGVSEVNGGGQQRRQHKFFDTNFEPQRTSEANISNSNSSSSIRADVEKPAVNTSNSVVNKSDRTGAVTNERPASGSRDLSRPMRGQGDHHVTNERPEVPSPDATDHKNSYRESWKSRNDTQNTFTFNFVNSKKDVSHIENDGLDLTHRNKKVNYQAQGQSQILKQKSRGKGLGLTL